VDDKNDKNTTKQSEDFQSMEIQGNAVNK